MQPLIYIAFTLLIGLGIAIICIIAASLFERVLLPRTLQEIELEPELPERAPAFIQKYEELRWAERQNSV